MNGDDAARFIYAGLLALLLISALAARRLPMRQHLKMFAAWSAIFAALFVVFSFRPEIKSVWQRIKGELTGSPRQDFSGKAIKLTRQDDGHFWIRALLNGRQVDMMVDSGATMTSINGNTARAVNIAFDPDKPDIELATANGKVLASKAKGSIRVGSVFMPEHVLVVSNSFGETNVVGMNFLDDFESWNVKSDVMTLIP